MANPRPRNATATVVGAGDFIGAVRWTPMAPWAKDIAETQRHALNFPMIADR